jgi:hypothetical protein
VSYYAAGGRHCAAGGTYKVAELDEILSQVFRMIRIEYDVHRQLLYLHTYLDVDTRYARRTSEAIVVK